MKIINIKSGEPYDVYCGRANKYLNLPKSKWHNPFWMESERDRPDVLNKFEAYLETRKDLIDSLWELDDKRAACYCWPKDCHLGILKKKRQEQLENLSKTWNYPIKNGVLGFRRGFLSQWHGAYKGQSGSFWINNLRYNCVEQFHMAQKALLFNSQEDFEKIIVEKDPKNQQILGRKIKNFDQETWDKEKLQILRYGNLCKFDQNEDLKLLLLQTGNLILTEASKDMIYGCGFEEGDERMFEPEKWEGKSLLGSVLMEVREAIKNKLTNEKAVV